MVSLFTRRGVLQAGSAGVLGVTLPRLLRADATRVGRARAQSCILVFLNGGPSHLDMWDMKPNAPVEVRGAFQPIATSLPGVQLCEHLPRLARHMHKCTLVRSMHHRVNNAHALAVYTALTGHDRGDANMIVGAGPNDHPAIGSVVGMVRPPRTNIVPYVSLPFITKEGAGGPPQPGFYGGLLGRARDPLIVLRDPNAADFQVPELSLPADMAAARLQERQGLLQQMQRQGGERALRDLDSFQQRAFDLLTSSAIQRAFRMNQEAAAVRDAYGRNIYGQSVLLARRLIEAGTRVVSISWAPDANATWDTHSNNFNKLRNDLLPQLDAALSGLLTDLSDRGLLDETLVAVMGEFGRTPKVKPDGGRDHWNYCYSLLLTGGGIKPGHVYGASDRLGAQPSNNPTTPADIVATIYHCLGIARDHEVHDNLSRPFQLVPWGDVIADLLV